MTQFTFIPMPKEGRGIEVYYETYDTQFGKSVIGSTEKGICYLAFGEEEKMIRELKWRHCRARWTRNKTDWQTKALSIISGVEQNETIPLHVRGTDFQLNVWNELLKIPSGKLSTYKTIAENIGNPKANRAVGTAVGQNPVSYLIPCHRVVRTDGGLGGYHWGIEVKKKMLGMEKACIS